MYTLAVTNTLIAIMTPRTMTRGADMMVFCRDPRGAVPVLLGFRVWQAFLLANAVSA